MLPQLVPQQDTNLEPIRALNENFDIIKLVQRAVPKLVLARHSPLSVLVAFLRTPEVIARDVHLAGPGPTFHLGEPLEGGFASSKGRPVIPGV